MPICVKCHYYDFCDGYSVCKNSDLPITNYVDGERECRRLNDKGSCEGFKSISESNPIYVLKAKEQ